MTAEIVVEVNGSVAAAPGQAFATVLGFDPRRLLSGYGPVAGVAGHRNLVGEWARPGDRREVQMTDGTRITQELLYLDAPTGFGYLLPEVHGPIGLIVRRARAHWRFATRPDGRTVVTWRYVFEGPRGLPYLAGWFLVRVLWAGYMRAALRRALAAVDGKV
jgi:hypothetical protein